MTWTHSIGHNFSSNLPPKIQPSGYQNVLKWNKRCCCCSAISFALSCHLLSFAYLLLILNLIELNRNSIEKNVLILNTKYQNVTFFAVISRVTAIYLYHRKFVLINLYEFNEPTVNTASGGKEIPSCFLVKINWFAQCINF